MPIGVGNSSKSSSINNGTLKSSLVENAKGSSPSLSRLSSTEDSIPQQRAQQQQRPHLANLRSAWSSRELKTGSKTMDANAKDIGLPPIQLPPRGTSSNDDLLQNEVKRLQVATPIASILGLIIGGWQSITTWPIIIAWLSLFIIHVDKFMYTQQILSVLTLAWSLVSTTTLMNHHPSPQLFIITMTSFGLISAATCLSIVAGRIDQVSQQQFKDERKRAQSFVNEAVEQLKDQRLSFLSTISQEVQDAALMVITTLEQFSPSSILMDTHELLSACSIAVPIASISAINTTIKQVCYVSSHLQLLGRLLRQQAPGNDQKGGGEEEEQMISDVRVEFDIGDMVQNVGDALAGMAAQLGVNLVVYHSENGMHYTNVLGDEGAIRHGLFNLLRNILEGCTPGAIIELGLNIGGTETQGKILVTFEIIHSISPAIPDGLSSAMLPNANLTVQLLQFIGAKLSVGDGGKNKTRYEVTMEMDMGSKGTRRMLLLEESQMLSMSKHMSSIKFSNEPSLKDLTKFIEGLKGLRMVLHARERSVFAKHLTSCLAGWNADISHVPVVRQQSNLSDNDDVSTVTSDDSSSVTTVPTPLHPPDSTFSPESISTAATTPAAPGQPSPRINTKVPSPAIAEEKIHSIPPAFVLIDDDVETLERKIKEFRTQPPISANTLQHQHHIRRHKHSKSSANNNTNNPQSNYFHQGTTAIIHFTSLNNFKRVRDTLQWIASTVPNTPFSMPRLVVVPKPAGPRRFLTALHTAWNNAVVEPHFIPIATSPLSPMPQTPLATVMQQQQQRDSYTPPTPGSAYIGTPGSGPGHDLIDKHHRRSPVTEQGGRRVRPGSGIYSPSHAASSGDGTEGGNYFSMVGNGGNGTGTTTGSSSSATTRRQSHTELGLQQQQKEDNKQDQQSTIPPEAQQAGVTVAASAVATTALPEMSNGEQQQDIKSPTDNKAPASAPSPSTNNATNDNNTENNTKKSISVPRKMNYKLNKRKKASAFANVVSPPINVLIVEDNMINQAILSTWMKKHKIKCSVASNGQEAVERWKGGGFHLVLMDIQLPVMDGIEATKTIRAIEKEQRIGVLPTTSPTPSGSTISSSAIMESSEFSTESMATAAASAAATIVDTTGTSSTTQDDSPPSTFRSPVIIVALTASSLESDRHAALAAGCNDFLTKPVSLEWLEKKTIEWGCMQALIDFEGWRRWKRSATDKPGLKTTVNSINNTTTTQKEPATATRQLSGGNIKNEEETAGKTTTSNNSTTTTTTTITEEEDSNNKKLQSPSSSSTTRNAKGIVLPGAAGFSKRRFSTFDDNKASRGKSILLMSKSGSDSDLLAGRPQGDKDRRQQQQQQQASSSSSSSSQQRLSRDK